MPTRAAASVQKCDRERGNVRRALAKRRNGDAHDVETEAEIGAEPVRRDLFVEPAIRGRDDAGVDAARHVLADAPHFPILQHAKQLGLRARRQLAHFVEEDRAAIGFLEEPRALADRAGERAARVAEELRLEQVVGERRAVDRAQAAVAPRTEPMHAAGDELLAAAALPFDEHWKRRARRAQDRRPQARRGFTRRRGAR